MSDPETAEPKAGISTRTMEIAVALVLLAVSALVVFDSYRLGSKWGDDGPQSGYFPFYIGLLLGIASLATLVSSGWSMLIVGLCLACWKAWHVWRNQFLWEQTQ